LQSNQVRSERGSRRGRQRGLANAGFPLEKERTLQAQREEQRNGEAAIRHVMLGGQALLKVGNRFGKNGDASDRTERGV